VLRYDVTDDSPSGFVVRDPDGAVSRVADVGDLVFELEKAILIAVQKQRPDLLFLHAAALERDGSAIVLVGESGHGKSTTAWGLLHHGFSYLSDELAPVDLRTLEVLPYPHALCLKQRPPPAYSLPDGTVDLGATLHVPVRSLPAAAATPPCILKAVFIVRHDAHAREPSLQRISTAEAAAKLYVSTLNALAHEARGLDAVLRVAGSASCFTLQAADLGQTCELVARLRI
jgi:hypothetical protein